MARKPPNEVELRRECCVLARLAERDDTGVALAEKYAAAGHMLGEPPSRVIALVGRRVATCRRALDCGTRPAAGTVMITWLRRFGD